MSKITDQIERVSALARERIAYVREAERARELARDMDSAPVPKTPVSASGVVFGAEGAETFYTGAEIIDLALPLPAREVGWDLTAGRYRIELELESAGTVSAYDADGEPVFEGRRVAVTAVLDVVVGRLRLVASAPITRLSLTRLERRGRGEIVLGPFRADGIVSASVVGYGDWECEVAYDYDVYRHIEPDGTTRRIGSVDVDYLTETVHGYGAAAYGDDYGASRGRRAPMTWSVARAFAPTLPAPLPAPVWAESLPVGRTHDASDTQELVYTRPQVVTADFVAHGDFWHGLGEWSRFGVASTPELEPYQGWWTYLWGRVSADPDGVLERAYSMDTGTRVALDSLSVPGWYLLGRRTPPPANQRIRPRLTVPRVANPSIAIPTEVSLEPAPEEEEDSLVLEGVWGRVGEPLRTSLDPLAVYDAGVPVLRVSGGSVIIDPGTYTYVPVTISPSHFLVRLRGTGLARAVDIRVESTRARPDARPVTTSFREELAHYSAAAPRGGRDRVLSRPGRGLVSAA